MLERKTGALPTMLQANLENGLITALLKAPTCGHAVAFRGWMDGGRRSTVMCLNLRDGRIDTISQRWIKRSPPAETVVVANADDPTLSHLGQHLPQRVLFWLKRARPVSRRNPHAVDSICQLWKAADISRRLPVPSRRFPLSGLRLSQKQAGC